MRQRHNNNSFWQGFEKRSYELEKEANIATAFGRGYARAGMAASRLGGAVTSAAKSGGQFAQNTYTAVKKIPQAMRTAKTNMVNDFRAGKENAFRQAAYEKTHLSAPTAKVTKRSALPPAASPPAPSISPQPVNPPVAQTAIPVPPKGNMPAANAANRRNSKVIPIRRSRPTAPTPPTQPTAQAMPQAAGTETSAVSTRQITPPQQANMPAANAANRRNPNVILRRRGEPRVPASTAQTTAQSVQPTQVATPPQAPITPRSATKVPAGRGLKGARGRGGVHGKMQESNAVKATGNAEISPKQRANREALIEKNPDKYAKLDDEGQKAWREAGKPVEAAPKPALSEKAKKRAERFPVNSNKLEPLTKNDRGVYLDKNGNPLTKGQVKAHNKRLEEEAQYEGMSKRDKKVAKIKKDMGVNPAAEAEAEGKTLSQWISENPLKSVAGTAAAGYMLGGGSEKRGEMVLGEWLLKEAGRVGFRRILPKSNKPRAAAASAATEPKGPWFDWKKGAAAGVVGTLGTQFAVGQDNEDNFYNMPQQ